MPRSEPSLLPLLHAVASGRPGLGVAPLDEALVEYAVQLGLGPLLNHVAGDEDGALPPAGRTRVAGADMAGESQHACFREALCEILDASTGLPGGIALLKGISVCAYYPRPHLRTMGDLDLLVAPSSLVDFERVLRDLGYRPVDFGMEPGFYADHHHMRPFMHPQTNVRIEAHRGLFPPNRRIPDDGPLGPENVRAQLVDATFEGRQVYRFVAEMELLYAAAHWAYDMQLPLVHVGLVDSLMIMTCEGSGIDWDRVCDWADTRETATPLCVLLGYLAHNRLVSLAERTSSRLSRAPKSMGRLGKLTLYRIVDTCLAGPSGWGPLTKNLLEIVWQGLVSPGPRWKKLYSVPFDLVFPPRHPQRFSAAFQIHRLRSLLAPSRQPAGEK